MSRLGEFRKQPDTNRMTMMRALQWRESRRDDLSSVSILGTEIGPFPKQRIRLLRVSIAAGLCCFVMSSHGNAQTVLPTTPATTFETLLSHPPAISDAVFEKEMFPESVPEAARKQVFSVKLDGDNYFLSVFAGDKPSGTYGGRFAGIIWEAHGGFLTMSDPLLNKLGSALDGVEWVTRMTANMVINMGLFETVPGSAIWDHSQQRFVARMTDGRQVVAQFTYVGGLPTQARIKDGTTGQSIGSIVYEYRQDFHGGRLPKEFTRFADADAKNEKAKLFTVRIRKLEFSYEPISADEMNPRSVLRQNLKGVAMYSNSVLHLVSDTGKITRAQTAEEVNAIVEKMQPTRRSSRSLLFARLLIVGVAFGIPVLYLIRHLTKQKTKTKKQSENKHNYENT